MDILLKQQDKLTKNVFGNTFAMVVLDADINIFLFDINMFIFHKKHDTENFIPT